MNSLLVLLASLGLWPAPPPAPDPIALSAPARWAPDVGAARRYAASREGDVSFAVHTRERTWERRAEEGANSASVIKAMILTAHLRRPDVRDRTLTPAERALLEPMITWSSNEAASALYEQMGHGPLVRLARRARMRAFAPAPSWGLSRITAGDQARFFLRLPELLPPRHRDYALSLLSAVVAEQRWGIGEAVPAGWSLRFKGGWGAGPGAVSHQVALLRRGRQRVAVAVLTAGSPSPEYGRETLRGTFARLLRGLAEAPRADAVARERSTLPLTPWVHALRRGRAEGA